MSNRLRIVFMGTPGFAVESLAQLHASDHEVVGVVTAPDRPAGRGQKLRPSEVKTYALEMGVPILQPEKLRNEDFLSELEGLKADLFVVVAFRMLPEVVWAMPDKGTINLHASLLPQYRGAAPINWAIINGEKETGATTFFINAEIDKGAIIDKVHVPIEENDDAGDLHDRLMVRGAQLLVRTVDAIGDGTAKSIAQDVSGSILKKAPKLNPENRRIDWSEPADKVHDLIRGLSPYPSAYSLLHDPELGELNCKIYRTRIASSSAQLGSGQIETDGRTYLHVGTGSGILSIEQLQLPGKRKMGIKDLLNGLTLNSEARFE